MKLTPYARLPLLLLFALLQCVAPVAHAHVNGHHADHKIHLAVIEYAEPGFHDHGVPHAAAETDHSSVVSMPPEYRGADLTIAQAAAGEEPLLALREHMAPPFVTLGRQALPLLPYQHPCSQAPPV